MTFQPVVPFGGIVGWQYLRRTMDMQREAFEASPTLQRDVDYFRQTIGSITTAEELVADRRLMTVALGAFGLDEDINNKFFIRKILEEGTLDRTALANRLADSRYVAFSEAFGFGNGLLPKTGLSGFAERTTAAFLERQFEIGVGQTDPSMRLALGFEREIPQIAERETSDETKWLTVLGNRPLRQVFETAFGLPAAFGTLDLDRQIETFRDRSERVFGVSDFSDFSDPDVMDAAMRIYFARSQVQGGASGSFGTDGASTALTLLSSASRPSLISLL